MLSINTKIQKKVQYNIHCVKRTSTSRAILCILFTECDSFWKDDDRTDKESCGAEIYDSKWIQA